MYASHMLAIAPSAPVMSLLAITSCSSVTAEMTTNATIAGPKQPAVGHGPDGRPLFDCPAPASRFEHTTD